MRRAAVLLAGFLATVPVSAQESTRAPEPAPERVVENLLTQAREGRPTIRGQAARRLAAMGEPARTRLLELTAAGVRPLIDLGPHIVAVLGELRDPELRRRLWQGLNDRSFPWRPAAAQSLAETAEEGEADHFLALLDDPLSPVRAAALDGLKVLDLRSAEASIRAMLSDPSDLVRRRAVTLLDHFGHPEYLVFLLEDLRRDDSFFLLPTGKQARYDSFQVLFRRTGDAFGYHPGQEIHDPRNDEGIAQFRARILEWSGTAALPEIPAIARAEEAVPGDVLGLEIRSCRAGEFFLRWNREDRLRVGLGAAISVPLPAGTVARLLEDCETLRDAVADLRFTGLPGCDLEKIHILPGDPPSYQAFQFSQGPDGGEKRPAELSELLRRLLQTVPADGEDPRLQDLLPRLQEALRAVGGPLG